MFIRGKVYLKLESLIWSDVNLDSLSEAEQNSIINYCYTNMQPFEECINKLIDTYEKLVNNQGLEKNEAELMATRAALELQPGNRLSLCINLLLNFPYTLEKSKDAGIYSRMLTSLAVFYYNHGENLLIIDHRNDEMNNQSRADPHIIVSLILFMMSGSTQASILENACYIHILHKVCNQNLNHIWIRDFDLATFASESPHIFIQLYDYLFYKNELCKEYLQVKPRQHAYLLLKSGLFTLYKSLAVKSLAQTSTSNITMINHESDEIALRELSKKIFLECLAHDLTGSVDILEKYFPELDVNLALALYFFQNNNHKSLLFSKTIHAQMLTLTQDDLFPHLDNLLLLFKYWLPINDVQLKQKALETLLIYFKKNHESVADLLIQYVKSDIDSALLFSDLIIEMTNTTFVDTACTILQDFKNSGNNKVFYNLYRLFKLNNLYVFYLLFKAAEMDNAYAKEELINLCKFNKSKVLEDLLFDRLKDKSFLAFQLLKENCQDPKAALELAIYSLEHQTIDGAGSINFIYELLKTNDERIVEFSHIRLLMFYNNLIKYSDDDKKVVFAMNQLKRNISRNYNVAINTLINYAPENLPLTFFLIQICLKDRCNYNFLIRLKIILQQQDNGKALQVSYYLFLIEKMMDKRVYVNLLAKICDEDVELAITQFIYIYEEHLIAPNRYKIYLNDVAISMNCAVTYLENKLAEFAQQQTKHQYVAAKIMSIHYIHQGEFLKAENFILICLKINPKNIALNNMIDYNFKYFSDSFKKFYFEKMKIDNAGYKDNCRPSVSNSIKSRIMFFKKDKMLQTCLEDEKINLKRQIATIANIPNEIRWEIFNQILEVRNHDDLSRIKGQLLKYTEPLRLRQ